MARAEGRSVNSKSRNLRLMTAAESKRLSSEDDGMGRFYHVGELRGGRNVFKKILLILKNKIDADAD